MNEEIFKIRKDVERAKSLFELAKDRFELIKIYPKEKTYKIVEEYYESIKELIVSNMYVGGFKTLSHIKMIKWFSENSDVLLENEIKLLDNLRRLRNGTLYYGEKVNRAFLENNEKEINQILNKMFRFVGDKLNEQN